jgi:hypothetical protein
MYLKTPAQRILLAVVRNSHHQAVRADPIDLAANTAGQDAEISGPTVLPLECVRSITIKIPEAVRIYHGCVG